MDTTAAPASLSRRRAQVLVELDGREAWWTPAYGFEGDPRLVAHAAEAAIGHYQVEWGQLPMPLTAGQVTEIAALTALMYENPGRTRILAWPDQVRLWWMEHTHRCAGELYGDPASMA